MAKKTWAQRFRALGFIAFVGTVVAFVIAGPGHRFGWLPLGPTFQLSQIGGLLGAIALIASVIGLLLPTKDVLDPKTPRTLVIVLLSAGLMYQLYNVLATAGRIESDRAVPPIHDISTDLQNPPAFVALIDARAGAMNPVEYAGEETARQQRAAYPDIQTLRFENTSRTAVLDAAADVAEDFGWSNITLSVADGRFEATDTTFWYGYKDDVVLRVQADGAAAVVDIRSKSREGISDLGQNAARIRKFSKALEDTLN